MVAQPPSVFALIEVRSGPGVTYAVVARMQAGCLSRSALGAELALQSGGAGAAAHGARDADRLCDGAGGENGVYTKHLLQAMTVPGLRVSPKSLLLCRNPGAERRIDMRGFESLEHEVNSTNPQHRFA
jgi:hypothetical protein